MSREYSVTIRFDTADVERAEQTIQTALRNVEAAGGRVQSKLRETAEAQKGLFSGFAGQAAAYAAGYLTVAAAVGAVSGATRSMVTEQREARAATAQLAAGLASTGNAVGYTVDQLNDMASGFQRTSTFADDVIAQGEALLLTFRSIGHDAFPVAMQAAIDLASRMGGDLQGALLMVGKAAQEPKTGLTAMSRAGVQFSDAQKEVIQGLVDTGQKAKAQSLIFAEIATQVGGSAKAAHDAAGGALEMQRAWEGFAERAGGPVVDAIDDASTGIAKLLEENHDLAQSLGDGVATALDLVVRGAKLVVDHLDQLEAAAIAITTVRVADALLGWASAAGSASNAILGLATRSMALLAAANPIAVVLGLVAGGLYLATKAADDGKPSINSLDLTLIELNKHLGEAKAKTLELATAQATLARNLQSSIGETLDKKGAELDAARRALEKAKREADAIVKPKGFQNVTNIKDVVARDAAAKVQQLSNEYKALDYQYKKAAENAKRLSDNEAELAKTSGGPGGVAPMTDEVRKALAKVSQEMAKYRDAAADAKRLADAEVQGAAAVAQVKAEIEGRNRVREIENGLAEKGLSLSREQRAELEALARQEAEAAQLGSSNRRIHDLETEISLQGLYAEAVARGGDALRDYQTAAELVRAVEAGEAADIERLTAKLEELRQKRSDVAAAEGQAESDAQTEALLRLARAYQESTAAVREAEIENEVDLRMRRALAQGIDLQREAVERQVRAERSANDSVKSAQQVADLEAGNRQLEQRLSVLGGTRQEQEAVNRQIEIENALRSAGLDPLSAEGQKLAGLVGQQVDLNAAIAHGAEAQQAMTSAVSSTVDFAVQLSQGGMEAIDVWRGLLGIILQLVEAYQAAAVAAAAQQSAGAGGGAAGAAGGSGGSAFGNAMGSVFGGGAGGSSAATGVGIIVAFAQIAYNLDQQQKALLKLQGQATLRLEQDARGIHTAGARLIGQYRGAFEAAGSIVSSINTIVRSMGGTLDSLARVTLRHTDSGYYVSMIGSANVQAFGEDVQAAIGAAIALALQNSDISGIGPVVAQALRRSVATSLEDLQRDLDLATEVQQFLDPLYALGQPLADLVDHFEDLFAAVTRLDLGPAADAGVMQGFRDALHEFVSGIEEQGAVLAGRIGPFHQSIQEIVKQFDDLIKQGQATNNRLAVERDEASRHIAEAQRTRDEILAALAARGVDISQYLGKQAGEGGGGGTGPGTGGTNGGTGGGAPGGAGSGGNGGGYVHGEGRVDVIESFLQQLYNVDGDLDHWRQILLAIQGETVDIAQLEADRAAAVKNAFESQVNSFLDMMRSPAEAAFREAQAQFRDLYDSVDDVAAATGQTVEEVKAQIDAAKEAYSEATTISVLGDLFSGLEQYLGGQIKHTETAKHLEQLKQKLEIANMKGQIEVLRQLGVLSDAEVNELLGLVGQVETGFNNGTLHTGGRNHGGGGGGNRGQDRKDLQDRLNEAINPTDTLAERIAAITKKYADEEKEARRLGVSIDLVRKAREAEIAAAIEQQKTATFKDADEFTSVLRVGLGDALDKVHQQAEDLRARLEELAAQGVDVAGRIADVTAAEQARITALAQGAYTGALETLNRVVGDQQLSIELEKMKAELALANARAEIELLHEKGLITDEQYARFNTLANQYQARIDDPNFGRDQTGGDDSTVGGVRAQINGNRPGADLKARFDAVTKWAADMTAKLNDLTAAGQDTSGAFDDLNEEMLRQNEAIADQASADIFTQLAQWTTDEADRTWLLQNAAQIKYDAERTMLEANVEILHSMGYMADDVYQRVTGIIAKLPDLAPPEGGSGSSSTTTISILPPGYTYDDLDKLRADLHAIIDGLSDQTLMDELDGINEKFAELRLEMSHLPATVDDWLLLEQAYAASLEDLNHRAEQSLLDLQQSLSLSDLSVLSPSERIAEARSQAEELAAKAAAGDLDAKAALGDALQQYLEELQAAGTASPMYAQGYEWVQSILASILGSGASAAGPATSMTPAEVAQVQALSDAVVDGMEQMLGRADSIHLDVSGVEQRLDAVRMAVDGVRLEVRGLRQDFAILGSQIRNRDAAVTLQMNTSRTGGLYRRVA